MKRGIITSNDTSFSVSDDDVWMTVGEIAELFYTTAGVVNTSIKAILKMGVLKKYEVCRYGRLENGHYADVYNLEMLIALSYRIDTGHSALFGKWLTGKIRLSRNKSTPLLVVLGRQSGFYC